MLSARPLLVVMLLSTRVLAQPEDAGLQRPERLTIGTGDQFLGSLSPDEKTLYFASNRNTTTELYEQDLAGTSKLLFDEGADVTWPRVSPDGTQLLYISYRTDASGQLCVRTLPIGERRCVDDSSGAVQAQWLDAQRIVLLARPAVAENMRISIVTIGKQLTATKLFDRNLTNLAVSPDGRWLVYMPVERYVERIGPGFAAKAGRALAAQRLDRPNEAPTQLQLGAPGLTGQPAFSKDGRTLFFVQFVSDSTRDGIIDANDHGTLFSVPFASDRDDAATRLTDLAPRQLTDASWNCQYPSPSAHRLIATCDRGDHLDAYALPPSGMVPADWTADRMRAEANVTTSEYELLLLHTEIMQAEKDPSRRSAELVSLVRLHLDLEEFEAADHFAARFAQEKDPATAGLGDAMRVLCEHRRALRARERGRLSLDFADDSKKRMATLETKAGSEPGEAAHHLVRSEIADVLGDKTLAHRELELVRPEQVSLPAVLDLYADRADALYRELDEREALFLAYRALSEHPALSETSRLRFARAAAATIVRGRTHEEAESALAGEHVRESSELELAWKLQRTLVDVVDDKPSREIRERVVALYREQKTPERRRAVVIDAIQRGYELGAQRLIERMAELYVADAPRGTVEYRRATRLYRRLVEDRAYSRLGEGKDEEARDDFLSVAKNAGSLESWAGYIDRRLHEGTQIGALEREIVAGLAQPNGTVGRFVQAYLIARKLPTLDGPLAERAVEDAIALIRGGWQALKDKPEALAIYGAVLHERYLHTGDRAAAQRASALYLIALDLAKRNPRYEAMLLAEMALLEAQVGNWRIAIDYFEQREKLPFVDNLNGLTHALIKARTLAHLDREGEAATVMDKSLTTADESPRMAPYRTLVLDRCALYNLAAGRFDRALALYDQLLPLLRDDKSVVGARNRFVAHLARAAAALGANKPETALTTLDGVEQHLATPGIEHALRWPHATEVQTVWKYRVVAEGLRAKAYSLLERWPDAKRALEARRALYEEQIKRGPVDELERGLALIDAQLAVVALEQSNGADALAHAKAAIVRLGPVVKRAGKPVDTDELVAMWVASEARLATDANVQLKLRDRLRIGIDALATHRDKKTAALLRWLEIELGLLGNGRGGLRTQADSTQVK